MHTATHLVCRVPCGTHGKCYGILAAVTFSSVCCVSCTQHTAKLGICRVYYFAVCFLAKHTANKLICRVCPLFAVCYFLGTRQMISLPCARFLAHGKHETHGKLAVSRSDSLCRFFMSNILPCQISFLENIIYILTPCRSLNQNLERHAAAATQKM